MKKSPRSGRRWDSLSRNVRAREPACRLCLASGRFVAAVATDHIVPVSAGGSVFDPANLQPLCRACHHQKSSRDRVELAAQRGPHPARVVVVDHPPGAPVDAWVRSRMAPGDVLASFDAILGAACQKGTRPVVAVTRARDALVSAAVDGYVAGRCWLTSTDFAVGDALAVAERHSLPCDLAECDEGIARICAGDAKAIREMRAVASAWHVAYAARG